THWTPAASLCPSSGVRLGNPGSGSIGSQNAGTNHSGWGAVLNDISREKILSNAEIPVPRDLFCVPVSRKHKWLPERSPSPEEPERSRGFWGFFGERLF